MGDGPASAARLRSQERQQPQQQSRAITTQTTQQSKELPLAAHRKSLIRPPELRIPSKTAVSTSSRNTSNSSPLSPRKSQPATPRNAPPSPRKPDMPPPRSTRSSSLRQPLVSSGFGSSTTVPAVYSRHHSQTVRAQTTTNHPAKQADATAASSSTMTTQRVRPRFNTFQQSFSPKKTVKPPTPTTSGGSARLGSDDSSLIPSSWPEIAALQTEILQLSLFHSSYLQRNAEWQASAEASLRKKYDLVAEAYRSTLAGEKETQRRLNLHALNLWFENSRENRGGAAFSEQIQTLSSIVQDVSDLSDKSGKYEQAVRVFEDWFEEADQIRQRRDRSDQGTGIKEVAVFVDPLDVSWKKELYALTTRLGLCARQLQDLDILGHGAADADEGRRLNHDSALVRIVTSLGEMITLMVDELNTMRTIERDIVRLEREWVSRRTELLLASPLEPEDRVGIWKTVLK